MSAHVIEGTWEEIERHKAELVGRRLRVIVQDEKQEMPPVALPQRPSALGKYAFVVGGSDAFADEKRAEVEREDNTQR